MFEYSISSSNVYLIKASAGLLVAHISHTCDADYVGSINGDPSMVFLPPLDRPDLLSSDYRFLTPHMSDYVNLAYNTLAYTDYSNYLNAVVNTTAAAGLLLGGSPVASTIWTEVGFVRILRRADSGVARRARYLTPRWSTVCRLPLRKRVHGVLFDGHYSMERGKCLRHKL